MPSTPESDRKLNGNGEKLRVASVGSEEEPCIEEVGKAKGKGEREGGGIRERAEQRLRSVSGLSRRGLLVAGAVLLVLVLLLVTVTSLAAAWPRTPHHRLFPVCQDAACLRAAAQIREGLNSSPSACPCVDIWSWACGGWLAHNALPPDRSLWNQRQHLRLTEYGRIREMLGTVGVPLHAGTVQWKLKHLYDSCMELDNVDADGVRPLLRIISDLGGWHIMREWSVHSWDYRRVLERLHAEYGATPFFRVTVEPNPRSPNTSSIRISPSGLGLPDRTLYYADPDNKIVNAYKRLLKDIVTLLRATTSEALKFSTDIFYYEKRIAEITPESALLQDPINTYNPISVSELKITAASLPLREILVSMFPNAGITDETEILVSSPDYLTAVSGIVSSTDRSALNNYVIWTLVRVYLPYLPSEYTAELQQYTSELTGVDVPLQRWEVCTDMVQRFMGLAVQAELESRSPISDRASATVHDIFRNVRNAAKDLLSYHHFPTDFLKHIKQKVSSLSIQVGLPKNVTTNIYLKNYYSKLYVQKSNLFQNIFNGFLFLREEQQQRYLNPQLEYRLIPYSSRQSVTARYSASVNTIVVPGALLSLSHFSAGDPKSVMYGRIGMDIASAVVSGLLPWDSSWSGSGQLLSPYRPEVNQSLLATDQLRRCLSASVTQHNLATDHLANITSLSSLKHVFALRLAHNALVFSLKSDAHIHQPTLETYEDAALFFITYAQSQCSRYSPQQELLDNLVEFKLADKILLYVSWWHVPNFSKSLQCAQHETSCSDLL